MYLYICAGLLAVILIKAAGKGGTKEYLNYNPPKKVEPSPE